MKRDCRTIRVYFSIVSCILLLICFTSAMPSMAAEVNMTEVRKLAGQPVKTILRGTPVTRVSDGDYQDLVRKSTRPVVVLFYIDQDQDSRNLATLIRYLSVDFQNKITFCSYEVAERKPISKDVSARLQKTYSLDKVPGTFFYDNDKGAIELEREDYDVPTLKEYRTPKMLIWKTYYKTITKYIEENILD
jgi:hypothetical protein